MRTKEKIMSEVAEPFNFDKVEQMQGYLLIELLCDIRDTLYTMKVIRGKKEEGKDEKIYNQR